MFKNLIKLFLFFFWFTNLVAQSNSYYSSINPTSALFISDLESRVRSPYTRIDYGQFDETNVANFASRDTTSGQRVVTCVYSGFNYVYTQPFTWSTFSREHTWCQSWMPYVSSSTDQYQDQHHIFQVHQNSVNGVRSNHPFGIVASITSQFYSGKYGKNAINQSVYEPRDKHKGDAARALLYMCIRYDGVGGYTWNFDWLNSTKLPSLSEAPQDLNLLLQWHKQDPPDKWEVDRNNYIESIQGNRNPFVDHPEFTNYIDFNNLSKLSPSYSVEPDAYPTNLSAHKISVINITWTDAAGTQLPSGYLLMVFDKDNYFIPIDGEVYSDDSDLSDGVASVNVDYSLSDSYDFSGGDLSKTYYFRMYSFNGAGGSRNYKIDATVPSANTTVALPVQLNMFKGSYQNKKINLFWSTATEVNNYGFQVEHKNESGNWEKVSFVQGHGNSNSKKDYSFNHDQFCVGSNYYRLRQIDFDGAFEYSNIIEVKAERASQTILGQNFPNPFNPETVITYQLAANSHVSLKVFDALGKEIKTLINETKQAGVHHSVFSAGNEDFPAGIYFYQLIANGAAETKKMILLK